MEYGCIGEKLGHSFSKEIHRALGSYDYELCELTKEELVEFMKAADFKAINVTIPYKEAVIPYLDFIDDAARAIGAVNTIVKKSGKLYGYNTDFYGMTELAHRLGVEITGKKVAILGTGGTSKTAKAVMKSLGAGEILVISRTPKENEISYAELYEKHSDTEFIVNTTPVGMYPSVTKSPADISRFERLSGVIDAVYNPLRSTLVLDAQKRGIPALGGLYMLVAQGVRASEIFLDTVYPHDTQEKIYEKTLREKESIVLTGMPSSGKSTVGRILKESFGREFIDTDEIIKERIGMSIPEYFKRFGESEFRKRECEVIFDISALGGKIIATGGGAILRQENVENLKRNGKIYFLDRSLELLVPTSDRPTANDRAAIEKLYQERYEIYKSTADVIIDANLDATAVADRIGK